MLAEGIEEGIKYTAELDGNLVEIKVEGIPTRYVELAYQPRWGVDACEFKRCNDVLDEMLSEANKKLKGENNDCT